jgi:hypothetical protein
MGEEPKFPQILVNKKHGDGRELYPTLTYFDNQRKNK